MVILVYSFVELGHNGGIAQTGIEFAPPTTFLNMIGFSIYAYEGIGISKFIN